MKMLMTLPFAGMSRLEHHAGLIYAELQGNLGASYMSFEHDAELAVLAINKAQMLIQVLDAMEGANDNTESPC
jgi:hypothetical protein